jgi:hypothetical protein
VVGRRPGRIKLKQRGRPSRFIREPTRCGGGSSCLRWPHLGGPAIQDSIRGTMSAVRLFCSRLVLELVSRRPPVPDPGESNCCRWRCNAHHGDHLSSHPRARVCDRNAIWWTSDGSYVSGPNYNPKQCGGRVSFYNGGTSLQSCTITISESNLYSAPSAYDQVAKAAASDWNNAINGSKTFFYYSVGGSGGPVTITSADLGGPNSNGVTTIGLARYSYVNNPP